MSDKGVIVRIRDLILGGDLPPGARVTEIGVASMLGVSRTPIRNALPALLREGLLEEWGQRGYAVRSFTARESMAALEARATIEGMAARMIARQGPGEDLLARLHQCLAEGDALFAKRSLRKEDERAYGEMNGKFHTAIIEAVRSSLITDIYARICHVPFAAPAVIAFDSNGLDKAFELLFYAHGQHHAIVDAIANHDGERAEFLFREHANPQRASMWAMQVEEQATAASKRRRKRR